MSLSKMLIAVFGLILFAGAAVAQDPVPLYPQNYKVLLENDALPQKSGIQLETVSTTCGSGWVRSCAATELLNTGVKAAHPPATAGWY